MLYSANGCTRKAINHILISWHWHSCITSCRVFRDAQLGNTGYWLLVTHLRIRLKLVRQGKGKLHFDVSFLRDPQIAASYSCSFANRFSLITEEDHDESIISKSCLKQDLQTHVEQVHKEPNAHGSWIKHLK